MRLPSFDNPLYFGVVGLLCGVFGFRVGWRSNQRIVLPVVQGVVGGVAFALAWSQGSAIFGAVAMTGWAVGTSLYSIPVFKNAHGRIDERILGARRYRQRRVSSLERDQSLGSHTKIMLRDRVRQLGLFLVAAVLTANLASFIVAALMLNAFNAYVAVLLRGAHDRWTVRLIAWDVWNVVRLMGPAMLGSASAAPVASRLGYPAPSGEVRWLLVMGAIAVTVDLILELLLGDVNRRLLRRAVTLGPGAETD